MARLWTTQEIADAITEMTEASNKTKLFQNRVIGGFSVNCYRDGSSVSYMVGCAILITPDALRVLNFIDERQ